MTPAQFRKLLRDAGMSLAEAATALGVARSTTNRWAAGESTITPSLAILIRAVIKPKTS